MPRTYHVAKNGSDTHSGTQESPFLTINAAAEVARAGDTVIVHEGEYREWVKPQHGGHSAIRRIVYQAAAGERVSIKGSERVDHWENVTGYVWKAVLPSTLFGDWNPYVETIVGDWLEYRYEKAHLGDVYLNGMSFYEVDCLEDVLHPPRRTEVLDHWTQEMVPVKDLHQTEHVWFSESDADTTTIYANFQGADPNQELVEINVRKCCFYPDRVGINYITVSGFELAHAATPWAPPTADQPGLIGVHWSKGWIIENNRIHDSKCSAISIGKESSTGNNYRTFRKDKPGYQYQLESVFAAQKIGWSKEKIGSHIIRNNTIYNCGQNAIVGHLGCIFSEIYNNHIYNIAIKREFYGHEIAGIKLHAAIDVQIYHNHIHDCSLGLWLDWQAQGTRVSKNLLHGNNRDLFVEVSHGPYLVDNNILGSKYALDNHAQGGAYVHNLIAGKIVHKKMLNRATPYHTPHSTDVSGYAMVYGADDRFYQNLFVGGEGKEAVGTFGYDGCPTSLEEYIELVDSARPGDLLLFEKVEQPAYLAQNAYLGGALPFASEMYALKQLAFDVDFCIELCGEEAYLCCTLPTGFENDIGKPHTTASLGRVRIVDADFENADGTPLTISHDYLDVAIHEGAVPGPLSCLKGGKNRVKVWG